jgi:prepilin-type N-terminal cleavage/methylation domain-containing protein
MSGRKRNNAFTLLEMILAVSVLSVITLVSFYCFNAAVRSWIAGTSYINGITHADYILEQVAMGLRSAYYPDTGKVEGAYGMRLEDNGQDASARDVLTWVKLGSALVGADADYADIPHRVEIAVRDNTSAESEPSNGGFAVRAWRVDLQADDFDPGQVPFVALSPHVRSMNFRMLDPTHEEDDLTGELKWLDTWETADQTNRLPRAIEVTLYLDGPTPESDPVPVRRVVSVPLAELSWNPRRQESSQRRPR